MKGDYSLTILFLFFHRPSIENGMFFTDLPSWGLHLPMTPWKRRHWVHSLFSNCSHNRLCFNSPNSDSLICQGLSGKNNSRFTPLPLTHRHTPLAQSVKSKVVLLHVKILEKRTGSCNPTCFLSLFTKLVGPLRVKGKINRELVWYLAVDRVFILKFFAWTLIVSLYFYLKTDGRFCRGCRSSTILPPQCPISRSILYVSLHFWKPKVPWELWECPSMWVGLKQPFAILKTRILTGVNFTFTYIFDYGVI